MAVRPVMVNQSTLAATRAPALTPAQKISEQVTKDASTVTRLFIAARNNPTAFETKLERYTRGAPDAQFEAFNRMASRANPAWRQKVGSVIVARNNLTMAAKNALIEFSGVAPTYMRMLRTWENFVYDEQRQYALVAVRNYEAAVKRYAGTGARPSANAAKQAINWIDQTWVFNSSTLNPKSKAERAAFTKRLNAAHGTLRKKIAAKKPKPNPAPTSTPPPRPGYHG